MAFENLHPGDGKDKNVADIANIYAKSGFAVSEKQGASAPVHHKWRTQCPSMLCKKSP